jgi:prepilin-type N-terminal cleavage/methylation domain-containing protein
MTKISEIRDAGLTLIELLVVLALLGLLGGLAAAGLRAASGSWQRVVLYNSDNEELLATERLIREHFSQILPEKRGNWSKGAVRFGGTADRIQFLVPLAQRFGAADIVLYTLSFPGDGTLRVAWQLDRDTPSGRKSFAPAPSEEVFEGISQGEFSYFGLTDDGQALWRDSWQDQQRLPQMMRMRFVWRGQPEELIVAPLLTTGPCSVADSDLPCSN